MRLTETNVFESANTDDIEEGVIRNVKIVGVKSRNRRNYPLRVLKEAAPKYEGKAVNINHHKGVGDRDANDGFGCIRKVHVIDNGPSPGLYGDLHFLTKHEFAGRLVEAAQRMPEMYGLSHDVEAATRGREVTEISHVFCVDLVKEPGATSSLFESEEQPTTEQRIQEIDSQFADVAIAGGDPMMDAVRALLNAILDSGADSDEMRRMITVVLRMKDKLMGQEEEMNTESTQESVTTEVVADVADNHVEEISADRDALQSVTETVNMLTEKVDALLTDKIYGRVIVDQNIDECRLTESQVAELRKCDTYESMSESAEKLPPSVRKTAPDSLRVVESIFSKPIGSYEQLKQEMDLA